MHSIEFDINRKRINWYLKLQRNNENCTSAFTLCGHHHQKQDKEGALHSSLPHPSVRNCRPHPIVIKYKNYEPPIVVFKISKRIAIILSSPFLQDLLLSLHHPMLDQMTVADCCWLHWGQKIIEIAISRQTTRLSTTNLGGQKVKSKCAATVGVLLLLCPAKHC